MPPERASGLFRSEDMTKLDIVMQRDAAHDIVYHVGRLGVAQFLDMNPGETAFSRTFTGDVRRCEELERRLRYLKDQLDAYHVEVTPLQDEPELQRNAIDRLERELDEREHDVRHLIFALESLRNEYNQLRETLEVVKRVGVRGYYQVDASRSGLVMLSGVIASAKSETLYRLVWRLSRGNALVQLSDIEETFMEGSKKVQKAAFLIYVSSQRLQDKIRKVVDSLGGHMVDGLDTSTANHEALTAKLASLQTTLDQSSSTLVVQLRRIGFKMAEWCAITAIEKGTFATLNLVKCIGATASAQIWIPVLDVERFQEALAIGSQRAGDPTLPVVTTCVVQKNQPTYFRTNKFTESFQGLVDSYGMARYKEVNPGVLTIVTFPYLFGIMYGDLGHGTLLTIFAGTLILLEPKLINQKLNEMVAMIFGGRYLLFLMGIFATYIGLLYNDFFGFSVQIFESAYTWPALPPHGPKGLVHPVFPNGHPSVKPLAPVAVGIDVAWSETENKLEFYNSVKMKCAVIIGVVQMTVGLFLSLLNHLHRRDYRHIYFGFIPELIFLTCTFGYMAVIIVVKWLTPWPNTNLAPSLLETMTNFFLQPGQVSVPLYDGQAGVQMFLLLLAMLQVPILLVVIPILEKMDHNKKLLRRRVAAVAHAEGEDIPLARDFSQRDGESAGTSTARRTAGDEHAEEEEEEGHGGHGDGKKFDMAEIVIHYIIHTIEFVLGCVSNTASYLRLWALSLAHAQLSEVFMNFCLVKAISSDGGNGIALFLGVGVWLAATIGVLLCMESLSAFLHALRLHWVEFQNKFYSGDGVAFQPFNLMTVMKVEVA